MPPSVRPPKKRPPSSPYTRPSWLRRNWLRFRELPKWVTVGGAVLLLAGAAAAGYLYHLRNQRNEATRANIAKWGDFEKAAREGDEPGMRAALDAIVRDHPNDPAAPRWLAALESGEADPEDFKLAALTYRSHLRATPPRWPEADREARKRLAKVPDDWDARCMVAQAALVRNDVPAAAAELDKLPDLATQDVNISPYGLLQAFDLFARTGRDPAVLRQFCAVQVVDRIRNPNTRALQLALKLQLLACYMAGFDLAATGRQPEGLARAASSVGELVDSCLAEAAGDAPNLLRLAISVVRMPEGFALLRRDGKFDAEQAAALAADLTARVEKVWRALLAADPKSPAAYRGVAVADAVRKDYAAALATVDEGLKRCGDTPELVALQGELLRSANDPDASLRVLLEAAEKDRDNPVRWYQVAHMAFAVGRAPAAVYAAENARRAAPDDRRTWRLSAQVALVQKDPIAAVQALSRFPTADLARDPHLARLYVVGMVDGRMMAKLPDFLRAAEAAATAGGQPAAVAAALKAVTDASRYDADAGRAVEGIAGRLLGRWPDNELLLDAQAMALYKTAEAGAPDWDLAATGAAQRALRALRAKSPDNPNVAAAIAWVTLKGEKNANQAVIDAAPLAERFRGDKPLAAWHAQVLGTAYEDNGRHLDAIKVLAQARDGGAATPGVLIPLTLAYYRAGKFDEAAACFRLAQANTQRTPQEQADYLNLCSIYKP